MLHQYLGVFKNLPGTVQFWAAGRNCCEEGGGAFNCGDVRRGAKAGLVFLEDQTDVDGIFKKACEKGRQAHTSTPKYRWSSLFVNS